MQRNTERLDLFILSQCAGGNKIACVARWSCPRRHDNDIARRYIYIVYMRFRFAPEGTKRNTRNLCRAAFRRRIKWHTMGNRMQDRSYTSFAITSETRNGYTIETSRFNTSMPMDNKTINLYDLLRCWTYIPAIFSRQRNTFFVLNFFTLVTSLKCH